MPVRDDRPPASQELAGTSANIHVAPSHLARAWAFTVASLSLLPDRNKDGNKGQKV